jgi:hypothetical protein
MERVLWVCAALALAGCGSSDDGSNGTSTGGTSSGGTSSGGTSSGGTSSGGAGGTSTGGTGGIGGSSSLGCPSPLPSEWIFCEDFETIGDTTDVFFEHEDNDGDFVVETGEAASGSRALHVRWQSGEVGAGYVNVGFGKNPMIGGGKPHYRPTETFDEIYWRVRVKHQSGWPDVGPAKLTRATMMTSENWAQGMIAHLWSAGDDVVLLGDPAACITGSSVNCTTYNDFANLDWLGQMPGTTPIFSSAESGKWKCVEGHVKLNTTGASDGVFEFWIDGQLQASRSDLDWRGSYTEHGLNFVSWENYWNDGASAELERWMDDMAIATVAIGCGQ